MSDESPKRSRLSEVAAVSIVMAWLALLAIGERWENIWQAGDKVLGLAGLLLVGKAITEKERNDGGDK